MHAHVKARRRTTYFSDLAQNTGNSICMHTSRPGGKRLISQTWRKTLGIANACMHMSSEKYKHWEDTATYFSCFAQT